MKEGALTKHFLALITAQNGDVYEDIFFRPASRGKAFAFMFTVKRQIQSTNKFKTLKVVGWTEPKLQ